MRRLASELSKRQTLRRCFAHCSAWRANLHSDIAVRIAAHSELSKDPQTLLCALRHIANCQKANTQFYKSHWECDLKERKTTRRYSNSWTGVRTPAPLVSSALKWRLQVLRKAVVWSLTQPESSQPCPHECTLCVGLTARALPPGIYKVVGKYVPRQCILFSSALQINASK